MSVRRPAEHAAEHAAALAGCAALLAVCMHAGSAAADEPNDFYPKPTRETVVPYPPPNPRVIPPPADPYTYVNPGYYPSLGWLVTQAIPSPEFAVGHIHQTDTDNVRTGLTDVAFGLRWQMTPVLWSWGTNRRVTRWRWFVVDPLARNSGSLALNANFEYLFGHIDRLIVRPGVRATFPLIQKGEYLSASIGTSTYAYNNVPRVAYDVGAYVLWGLFGVQVTVAPENAPMSFIGTFSVKYF